MEMTPWNGHFLSVQVCDGDGMSCPMFLAVFMVIGIEWLLHVLFCSYRTSMVSGAKPSPMRNALTLFLWLPCSSMRPSLTVPPHASLLLSFFPRSLRSISLLSMPSTMVYIFPKFFLTDLTTIFCDSFAIVSQTQRSFWSPQVVQISLILLCSLLQVFLGIHARNVFSQV